MSYLRMVRMLMLRVCTCTGLIGTVLLEKVDPQSQKLKFETQANTKSNACVVHNGQAVMAWMLTHKDIYIHCKVSGTSPTVCRNEVLHVASSNSVDTQHINTTYPSCHAQLGFVTKLSCSSYVHTKLLYQDLQTLQTCSDHYKSQQSAGIQSRTMQPVPLAQHRPTDHQH